MEQRGVFKSASLATAWDLFQASPRELVGGMLGLGVLRGAEKRDDKLRGARILRCGEA